ncbi:helicase RepA family protein [Tissierella pigra]|uniref:AAA family ATPase n=1 Tax=Tissierella pigra TaxID=2607614 RepID=A0A6N7XZS1_9FIRM|nr:AAA family ATPase [Tissierella pigra]MBU5425059.1 helicase RepA family protein [Tissierella pigra]MSU02983.1 AAA family ATPase [Tissierella pigra]
MTKRFNTIDGETLMTMPLKPINFIIENLLSEGLHILAGSPKVGKSWLALWLSVAVAKGEEVWGNKVKEGTTLYLCFEDGQIRIQNRLFDITDEATDKVNFCTENARLGGDLEERIVSFIKENPDTVLIIIDTLQMIRNTSKDHNYANDYSDLTILKNLADKYGIAILLIHHLRKEYDKDPFNRISGTTGIQGAVDSSFILVEESRGSKMATLSCVGRDIDYREIKLERNEDNIWQVVTDSFVNKDVLLDDVVLLLSDFMEDKEYHKSTPTELAGKLSKNRDDNISPKTLSKKIIQNTKELEERSISVVLRKSNGKRLIEIFKIGH